MVYLSIAIKTTSKPLADISFYMAKFTNTPTKRYVLFILMLCIICYCHFKNHYKSDIVTSTGHKFVYNHIN